MGHPPTVFETVASTIPPLRHKGVALEIKTIYQRLTFASGEYTRR